LPTDRNIQPSGALIFVKKPKTSLEKCQEKRFANPLESDIISFSVFSALPSFFADSISFFGKTLYLCALSTACLGCRSRRGGADIEGKIIAFAVYKTFRSLVAKESQDKSGKRSRCA